MEQAAARSVWLDLESALGIVDRLHPNTCMVRRRQQSPGTALDRDIMDRVALASEPPSAEEREVRAGLRRPALNARMIAC